MKNIERRELKRVKKVKLLKNTWWEDVENTSQHRIFSDIPAFYDFRQKCHLRKAVLPQAGLCRAVCRSSTVRPTPAFLRCIGELQTWKKWICFKLLRRGYKACSNVSDLSCNWPTKWTTTNQRAFQGKPVEQSARWRFCYWKCWSWWEWWQWI